MLTTPVRIVMVALLSFFVPFLLVVCLGTGRTANATKNVSADKADVQHLVFAQKKPK